MQGNMKCCYACDRDWLRWSHWIFCQESVLLFHSRPKASTNFQPDLVFQRLTWLGPSRPFCSRNIGWWHFSNISSDTSSRWAHESTSLDVKRPMKCWLATLNVSSPTMSHALEKTKAARIGLICKSASSKLRFLLAWLLCFYTENPRIFFRKAIFATSPIVPAVTNRNNSHFALEN